MACSVTTPEALSPTQAAHTSVPDIPTSLEAQPSGTTKLAEDPRREWRTLEAMDDTTNFESRIQSMIERALSQNLSNPTLSPESVNSSLPSRQPEQTGLTGQAAAIGMQLPTE